MKLSIIIFALITTLASHGHYHPGLHKIKVDQTTPVSLNKNYKNKNEHVVTYSVQSPFKHDGSRIFVEKRTPVLSPLMRIFYNNNNQATHTTYTICNNDVQTNSYCRFNFQFSHQQGKVLFETMEHNYFCQHAGY